MLRTLSLALTVVVSAAPASADIKGQARVVDRYDLAASIIATGNALDCRRYSGGRYRLFETEDARRYIRQAPYC